MSMPPGKPARIEESPFPTTKWTLVRKIQRGSEADARHALEEVCRTYWYPVYTFLRRSGQQQHDAEDLTQAFFQRLIEERSIRDAQKDRGRLRGFLLGVLKRLLADHFEKLHALKRGGGVKIISFEEQDAETRYAQEPADLKSPDALFDRAWAEGVLQSAEAKLRADYERGNDVETFDLLREFLPLGDNATPYAKVAAKSHDTEATVRLQIHRMRKRYAKPIEAEIMQTVDGPSELKAELAHLMDVMGR
jgi:RNA polymerase sigma-70 factor (ECF subfamily)